MKVLLPAAYLLGLALKFLHLPYHTVFLLLVLVIWLAHGLRDLVRGKDKPAAMAHLATWAWLLHLLIVLKLLPFRTVTLALAVLLTVAAGVLLWRSHPAPLRSIRMLAGAATLVLLVMSVPTATRYQATNLAYSVERSTDVRSWDKYSFLLLREGRNSEAVEANRHALDIARGLGQDAWIKALENHSANIDKGAWTAYDPLPH